VGEGSRGKIEGGIKKDILLDLRIYALYEYCMHLGFFLLALY